MRALIPLASAMIFAAERAWVSTARLHFSSMECAMTVARTWKNSSPRLPNNRHDEPTDDSRDFRPPAHLAPNGFFMNWAGNQKGEGFEYHLLAIGLALAVIISGAGKWSIDC